MNTEETIKFKQVENMIDEMLEIYDGAKRSAALAKSIKEEQEHEKQATKCLEIIEHEVGKLRDLSSFQAEIKLILEQ